LIKQGAALEATWETVGEALPAEICSVLTPPESSASEAAPTASLFEGSELGPDENCIPSALRTNESTHIDQLVERLLGKLSSS
jgi:hypothetical protein